MKAAKSVKAAKPTAKATKLKAKSKKVAAKSSVEDEDEVPAPRKAKVSVKKAPAKSVKAAKPAKKVKKAVDNNDGWLD